MCRNIDIDSNYANIHQLDCLDFLSNPICMEASQSFYSCFFERNKLWSINDDIVAIFDGFRLACQFILGYGVMYMPDYVFIVEEQKKN